MSEKHDIVFECAERLLKTAKQLRSVDPTLSDLTLWISDKVLKIIENDTPMKVVNVVPKDIQPEIQELVNRIKGDCECQDCECQKEK